MTVAALYIRAFTTNAQREAESLANQQTRLLEWAESNGLTISEIYIEPEKMAIADTCTNIRS